MGKYITLGVCGRSWRVIMQIHLPNNLENKEMWIVYIVSYTIKISIVHKMDSLVNRHCSPNSQFTIHTAHTHTVSFKSLNINIQYKVTRYIPVNVRRCKFYELIKVFYRRQSQTQLKTPQLIQNIHWLTQILWY